MSGRDQPVPGGSSEPPAGTGYTSNPYDSHEAPGHATEQLPTAEHQPAQWGYPQTPTPPYGQPPVDAVPPPPPPPAAEPSQQQPAQRGPLWPWLVGAAGILVLAIVGSIVYYVSSVGSDLNNDAKFDTTIVSAPSPAAVPPQSTFVPRFVAFSGTVQSNDGSTLVITPKDGSAAVTVATNESTQVLLGGGQGIEAFKPGDGVFIQGSTQQDGKVMARMIIGSLFGN